jgi:hypothetical protein
MTDLSIVRGDSRNYNVTIYESDGSTPIDITEAVLRFAVKGSVYDDNSRSIIFKQSYYPDELQITIPASGESLIKLLVADTVNVTPGQYYWDLDVTRKGDLATSAGTFAVTAGSGVLTGAGVDFAAVSLGQIIDLTSGFPQNNLLVVITDFDSTAETITVGYTGFVDEAGITHTIYQGDRKTPTGLSGNFSIGADVVE